MERLQPKHPAFESANMVDLVRGWLDLFVSTRLAGCDGRDHMAAALGVRPERREAAGDDAGFDPEAYDYNPAPPGDFAGGRRPQERAAFSPDGFDYMGAMQAALARREGWDGGWVTLGEAAGLAGVSPSTLSAWVRAGDVKARRAGRCWHVHRMSLEKHLYHRADRRLQGAVRAALRMRDDTTRPVTSVRLG